MPTFRLRKRLLDRLVQSAGAAGELGLALLMTAGVVHCGGRDTGAGEGTTDASADHPLAIEAAHEAGPVIEAPWFPDAGRDAQPIVEAPVPVPDAGFDAYPFVEAAWAPDATADGYGQPIVEAPAPVPEAGTDASYVPLPEAPSPK